MGTNPRIVTEDRQIFWDGVTQRLPKGQQIDVPPDSPLERAIGRQYLVPLPGAPVQEAAPTTVVAQGGGGGATDSTAPGGGGSSTFAVTPVSPPRSRTVGNAGNAGSDSKDGGK